MNRLLSNILIAIAIIILVRAVLGIDFPAGWDAANEISPSPTNTTISPTPEETASPIQPFDDRPAARDGASESAKDDSKSVPALW